jgi:regulator of replication initiation timing
MVDHKRPLDTHDSLINALAEIDVLQRRVAEQGQEIELLHAENQRLRAEGERLRGRLADMESALENAQRAGKRQAAPFSKGSPKVQPKRPRATARCRAWSS